MYFLFTEAGNRLSNIDIKTKSTQNVSLSNIFSALRLIKSLLEKNTFVWLSGL